MLSVHKKTLNISRGVEPLSISSGCTTTLPILAWVYKHYQYCLDQRCTTFINVIRVYNFYQCYQSVQPLLILLGCTTFTNIIRVCNLYQYCQGSTTTIVNISRDVQHLSILDGVYKLYQCCQGVYKL